MENDSAAPPHGLMAQWVVYAHPRDYCLERFAQNDPAIVEVWV